MYFTKNVLAALLLAPSVLVSVTASIPLSGTSCGSLRTHHWRSETDYDDFQVCVRPSDHWRNYYKVIALDPEICENPSGSIQVSQNNNVGEWSTDGMAFAGSINESIISGTDFDMTCTGGADVQWIGPKAVQSYTYDVPTDSPFYAGFCVTNGSITGISGGGTSWGNGSLQADARMYNDAAREEVWASVSGPCVGKPLKIPGLDYVSTFYLFRYIVAMCPYSNVHFLILPSRPRLQPQDGYQHQYSNISR